MSRGVTAKLAIGGKSTTSISATAASSGTLSSTSAPVRVGDTSAAPGRRTLAIVPPKGHEFRSAALSPDGTMLAFSASPRSGGDNSLWVRRIDDGTDPSGWGQNLQLNLLIVD